MAVLGVACATKDFVQERVSKSESRFANQMTATQAHLTYLEETKLRVADLRLKGLDTQVSKMGALAADAKARADSAAASTQDTEARLAQRIAGRNKYRLLDTKSVYFGSGQTELPSQDVSELDEVAQVLAANPDAILELHGFADSQGSARHNRDLGRERAEAVMRYLMQRHGIELRQLHGITMGKVALAAGETPSAEASASARRVDVRLFAPESFREDAQAQSEQTTPERAASTMPAAAASATIVGLPHQGGPSLPQAAREAPPARGRLPELLRSITPKDLGAE
jgi:outer membrane protein OmpA-like peptidoglycan-associated protein